MANWLHRFRAHVVLPESEVHNVNGEGIKTKLLALELCVRLTVLRGAVVWNARDRPVLNVGVPRATDLEQARLLRMPEGPRQPRFPGTF